MILFFDTETTGLPKNWKAPITDFDNWPRLVQLAYQLFDNNGNIEIEGDYLVKPYGFTIPFAATKIHGISNEKANSQGISISKILNDFKILMDEANTIVAHNLDYDEKILACEFLRLNLPNPFINKHKTCTMKSSTNFCAINGPYGYKWPKLSELHYKLFNTYFEEAHNAIVDIQATSNCFWELVKRNIIHIPDHTDRLITDIFEQSKKSKEMTGIVQNSIEICPKCKASVAADDASCKNCGTIIRTSKVDTSSEEYSKSTPLKKPLFISDYDTLMEFAIESFELANYNEALEYFNKALKSCKNLKVFHLCNLYNGIGQANFGLGKYNEAESFFNKSIEIFPDFSAPYENLAATYFKMGKYEELFEICELISSKFPISNQIWYYLAHAHEDLGHYKFARVAYQNAIIDGLNECINDLSNLEKTIKLITA